MPIPVIAGLPWLAGIITSLLGSLVGFFTQRIVWKVGFLGLTVSAMAVLTGGLMAGAHAIVVAIPQAMPEGSGLALTLFLPTNLGACVGAMVSARLLRWVYDWQIRVLTIKVQNF